MTWQTGWLLPRSTSSHWGSEKALDHRVPVFPSTALAAGKLALSVEDAVTGRFRAAFVWPQAAGAALRARDAPVSAAAFAGAEPPTSQDLIRFARERIGYKAPEEIVVLDEMPRTATGKTDRTALKRAAEEALTR